MRALGAAVTARHTGRRTPWPGAREFDKSEARPGPSPRLATRTSLENWNLFFWELTVC